MEMIATETMVFNSSGVVNHFKQTADEKVVYHETYQVEASKVIDIFIYLRKHCLIDYMEEDYSELLCDGFLWDLTCEYDDQTFKKVLWNTEVPKTLDFVGFMIENLTEYRDQPLII